MSNEICTRIGRVEVKWGEHYRVWFWRNEKCTRLLPASVWRLSDAGRCVEFLPAWEDSMKDCPASIHNLLPPSDTLLSLLRSFHEHRAAYAVVDRLIEEYPELEPYLAGVTANATESVSNGVGATA